VRSTIILATISSSIIMAYALLVVSEGRRLQRRLAEELGVRRDLPPRRQAVRTAGGNPGPAPRHRTVGRQEGAARP
jgi:hypothetical protein